MDKQQNSPQTPQQTQLPIQITHEHFQQLQQLQLQQALGNIQVKQEYQNQQNTTEMKPQVMDIGQHHLQPIQMIEQQQQGGQQSAPQSIQINQQGTATLNTMSPLQQIQAGQLPEWQQNRLQVIPPTLQNFPFYTTATGQPVMMSSNLLGGQQQIQLIAAGKAFQGAALPTQQMLATSTQNKQVISNTGQSYGQAYALPSGSQQQTLVLSPFIQQQQQQQQNILPTVSCAQTTNKPSDQMSKQIVMQKSFQKTSSVSATTNMQQANQQANGQQCIQVAPTQIPTAQLLNPIQQAGTQAMQFTAGSWLQGGVPIWTTNNLQSSAVFPPTQIVIRNTNPDASHGMLIQQTPQLNQQAINQQQQNSKFTSHHVISFLTHKNCILVHKKIIF